MGIVEFHNLFCVLSGAICGLFKLFECRWLIRSFSAVNGREQRAGKFHWRSRDTSIVEVTVLVMARWREYCGVIRHFGVYLGSTANLCDDRR